MMNIVEGRIILLILNTNLKMTPVKVKTTVFDDECIDSVSQSGCKRTDNSESDTKLKLE
jgi:hypothetical protein